MMQKSQLFHYYQFPRFHCLNEHNRYLVFLISTFEKAVLVERVKTRASKREKWCILHNLSKKSYFVTFASIFSTIDAFSRKLAIFSQFLAYLKLVCAGKQGTGVRIKLNWRNIKLGPLFMNFGMSWLTGVHVVNWPILTKSLSFCHWFIIEHPILCFLLP